VRAGMGWALAERLGVSSKSIRRWARTEPGSRRHRGLVPVHVIAEAASAKTLKILR